MDSVSEARSERESELQSELHQSELEEARSMFAEAEKIATNEFTLNDVHAKKFTAVRAEKEKLEKELASS